MTFSTILGLTPGDLSSLFAGAIVLVVITAVIMKLLEKARRSATDKELAAEKATAAAEGQKIIAQAEAAAKSEFIDRR